MEKIYAVEFMKYSNFTHEKVRKHVPTLESDEYIDVGGKQFLIRESDIEYYRQFGEGFRSLTFVGYLGKGV